MLIMSNAFRYIKTCAQKYCQLEVYQSELFIEVRHSRAFRPQVTAGRWPLLSPSPCSASCLGIRGHKGRNANRYSEITALSPVLRSRVHNIHGPGSGLFVVVSGMLSSIMLMSEARAAIAECSGEEINTARQLL